jgi:tRNA modification GTPase
MIRVLPPRAGAKVNIEKSSSYRQIRIDVVLEDTIAAIATPLGTGGIGIIRVSGPRAEDVARLLFKPQKQLNNFESRRLYHGDIIAPDSGELLDEVLLTLMKNPHSYTGEDTLEIHCHGGYFILQSVFSAVIAAGCRPAAPGEFTKRAFLNNRLDLAQAEAVQDIIMAKTRRGSELALSHLKGRLSGTIDDLRGRLVAALAGLEAAIDFPPDEISGDNHSLACAADTLAGIIGKLQTLLATYEQGKIVRDGAEVVIAGKPNVGKSSLLNSLLGEKRAIVTPLPGTTRDFIEEFINIKGLAVKLTDTAGIRAAENIIEAAGIALVREKLATADLVLMIIDGSADLTEEDRTIMAGLLGRNLLLVVNKNDLPQAVDMKQVKAILPEVDVLRISAKYGDGLDQLKEAIHRIILGFSGDRHTEVAIANIRHKAALERAVAFLSQAREGALNNLPPELLVIDLRDALASLSEIVDRTTNEEILQEIFSRFCIGK